VDLKEAEIFAKRAARIKEADSEIWWTLGIIAQARGDLRAARIAFRKAVDLRNTGRLSEDNEDEGVLEQTDGLGNLGYGGVALPFSASFNCKQCSQYLHPIFRDVDIPAISPSNFS